MITITKHQEIVDGVAGEESFKIYIERNRPLSTINSTDYINLTLPEARELLSELSEKLK